MTTPKKGWWKKGRGKLGALDPLLGSWQAEAESPMGPVRCTRTFSHILGGHRVLLEARWQARLAWIHLVEQDGDQPWRRLAMFDLSL